MRCLWNGVHPCGKCPACLANRQRGFMFRLDQEKEFCSWYFWLTLQYSDEFVPRTKSGAMCFSKEHCRLFFEHLRIKYREQMISFKHFLVSEYGPNSTHRPHYHLLLLVYAPDDMDLRTKFLVKTEMRDYLVHQAWKYGHVTEKSYHGRVLSYLTKYCCKPEIIGQFHEMPPFTLISRGIGLQYLDKLGSARLEQMRRTLDFTVSYGSGKMQLPRYHIEKIFPHSTAALNAAMNTDSYDIILLNRARLKKKQKAINDINRKKFENTFSDTYEYVEKQASDRSFAFEEFKTKIKQRKSL